MNYRPRQLEKLNEGYRFLKILQKRGQRKSAKWPLKCYVVSKKLQKWQK